MDLLNIEINKLVLSNKMKNFYVLQCSDKIIEINLQNIFLPFGAEKYNDKLIKIYGYLSFQFL